MEHKLLLHARQGHEHHTLSIKTLRGLAMIGMREGQIFACERHGEGREVMEIEMIKFQPEADGDLMRPDPRVHL